jgi:hypothetical protein
MDATGHTSAKVRAQKVKGTPRIDLKLSKLEGNAAHDIMGAIVNSLFKVFQACSSALSAGLFCFLLACLSEYGDNFIQL